MPKIRKKTSKRQTLRKQYKIGKQVREKQRKLRKEAKKMGKLGIKKPIPKPQGIPHAVPFKSEMLDEAEEFDRMRAEAAKEAAALKRAEKQLKNGTNQSVAEIVKGDLIQKEEDDHSKLTPEEVKEAERLMVLTGELDAPATIGMSRRAHFKEMKKMLDVADVVL